MKDVKEIIKGLRTCADDDAKCEECPYDGKGEWCSEQMKKDAADALEAFMKEEDDLK